MNLHEIVCIFTSRKLSLIRESLSSITLISLFKKLQYRTFNMADFFNVITLFHLSAWPDIFDSNVKMRISLQATVRCMLRRKKLIVSSWLAVMASADINCKKKVDCAKDDHFYRDHWFVNFIVYISYKKLEKKI